MKRPTLGARAPRPTRGARPPAGQRRRFRLGAPAWLTDIVSELRKVTWPSRDDTVYLTMVVVIVAIAMGAFLGVLDMFFNWLLERLLLR